jgi:hypothetical protein
MWKMICSIGNKMERGLEVGLEMIFWEQESQQIGWRRKGCIRRVIWTYAAPLLTMLHSFATCPKSTCWCQ